MDVREGGGGKELCPSLPDTSTIIIGGGLCCLIITQRTTLLRGNNNQYCSVVVHYTVLDGIDGDSCYICGTET